MAIGGLGKIRNPWGVIGLSIITLGIYFIYWQYASFKELKDSSQEGIGGGLGLVFAIFIPIVNSFMLPSEIGHLFERQGKAPPVTGVTGFWVFLPFVGFFVWVVKVQGRLNEFWESGGVAPLGGYAAPPVAGYGAPPAPPAGGYAAPAPSGELPGDPPAGDPAEPPAGA
ncbi:MAG: DUF4234 domain-containing protein [Acidimicrobiales bacterium]